ncbi:hypothetical protein GE061_001906 [Apolygus lucorum]|uniref:Uncharacterized protein n=1 Tax=Apolygus lucorum TaxID=248454 RepID=A0A8S9X503_APOLU|nr:hypothetical protein GE061_001906 [Apolygus lucorum]
MNQTERVMLVDRMKFLVSELYRLESYCPQNQIVPNRIPPPSTAPGQAPCFMLKCQLPRCRSNPDLEPLITWTPVMEVRRTTNPKLLKNPADNPLVKHVYVDPVQRTSVCGQVDPCAGLKEMTPSSARRRSSAFHGPGRCMPCENDGQSRRTSTISHQASKCTPALRDGAIEFCCPTFGPPVDSCGQPYHCQVTLDGRTVCKPTDDISSRPQTGCDRKQPQSRFSKCEEKRVGINLSPNRERAPSNPNANLESKRQSMNFDRPKSRTPSRSSPSKDKRSTKSPGHYCSGDVCICCMCSKQVGC